MSRTDLTALGFEYQKRGDQAVPKIMFFGIIVILTHMLKIRPAEFDVGGLKIAVDDVIVIHGSLALVFFFFLWTSIIVTISGGWLVSFNVSTATTRNVIRQASRPYRDSQTKKRVKRSPRQAKLYAKRSLFAYNVFFTPYLIAFFFISITAFVMGASDVFYFTEYLLKHLGILQFLSDLFSI